MTSPEWFHQMQRRQEIRRQVQIQKDIAFNERGPPYGDHNFFARKPLEVMSPPSADEAIKGVIRLINQYKNRNPGMTFEEAAEHYRKLVRETKPEDLKTLVL